MFQNEQIDFKRCDRQLSFSWITFKIEAKSEIKLKDSLVIRPREKKHQFEIQCHVYYGNCHALFVIIIIVIVVVCSFLATNIK